MIARNRFFSTACNFCGNYQLMEKSIQTIELKRRRYPLTEKRLAANRANAQKGAGRRKGPMSDERLSFKEACCQNDMKYIAVLNDIALNDPNPGFRMTAIRDLFDRGHGRPGQLIEGTGVGGAVAFQVILPAALCDTDES
jgi:hypothetical protein